MTSSSQTRGRRSAQLRAATRPPAQDSTPARGGPRLRSAGETPPALSASVTSFLGRDEDIAELARLLASTRLVTLTGAPGIGKSRLALEVAGELRGGRLVELAAISDPALVPGAVASALSVREVAGQSITDTLVASLSRRSVLLVLDNCEHLLGPCAELVEAMLSGCSDLSVLATSREPLALADEHVWQVPPLPVPTEEDASAEVLPGYAAVRLFVERTAAVAPGFALNAYLTPAVAEVCRRLDGIPLAIELAAARVESLTPEEIARRLDDRFSLLTASSAGVLARHQTLQAALDWSYELLSAAERALLRRLSVFVGGFELEAAEAVCAGAEAEALKAEPGGGGEPGDVLDLLERLRSKSLVVADASTAARPRYRLLETVRAYAAERLEEAGETAQLRAAHARWCLALAERAEPELIGPGQERWLERLEGERANLRSAFEWSLSHGRGEWALRLSGALVLFWRVRCHFSEGRELLDAAVASSEGAAPGLRAKALWGAGFMALMVGEIGAALPLVEESLVRFRELGDRQGSARALLILGSCRQLLEGSSGLALLEESAAEAKEADDSWCLDHALALAGLDHSARDDLSAARGLFEECLAVARNAQDKQGLRFGLIGLGSVAVRQGDYQLAESLLEEGVRVAGDLGEDYSKAVALQHVGQVAVGRGNYPSARALLDEALWLIRGIGSAGSGPTLVLLATVAHAEGDPQRAHDLFGEALAAAGKTQISIPALLGMGELAAAQGDMGAARRLFEQALEMARRRGEKGAMAQALYDLGQLARADGEPKRAAVFHDEALQLEREIGSAPGIVASLEAVAGLSAEGGRYVHAASLMGAAQALRREKDYALAPWDASRYEADMALLREGLSASELLFAFANGAALSLEEAAARASQGHGRRGRPASGWPSLTEREQEVAALVAEGLTNREIAECLYISRGTVKRHLAHIFEKLGAAGRTDLAREVRRRSQEPLASDR